MTGGNLWDVEAFLRLEIVLALVDRGVGVIGQGEQVEQGLAVGIDAAFGDDVAFETGGRAGAGAGAGKGGVFDVELGGEAVGGGGEIAGAFVGGRGW